MYRFHRTSTEPKIKMELWLGHLTLLVGYKTLVNRKRAFFPHRPLPDRTVPPAQVTCFAGVAIPFNSPLGLSFATWLPPHDPVVVDASNPVSGLSSHPMFPDIFEVARPNPTHLTDPDVRPTHKPLPRDPHPTHPPLPLPPTIAPKRSTLAALAAFIHIPIHSTPHLFPHFCSYIRNRAPARISGESPPGPMK